MTPDNPIWRKRNQQQRKTKPAARNQQQNETSSRETKPAAERFRPPFGTPKAAQLALARGPFPVPRQPSSSTKYQLRQWPYLGHGANHAGDASPYAAPELASSRRRAGARSWCGSRGLVPRLPSPEVLCGRQLAPSVPQPTDAGLQASTLFSLLPWRQLSQQQAPEFARPSSRAQLRDRGCSYGTLPAAHLRATLGQDERCSARPLATWSAFRWAPVAELHSVAPAKPTLQPQALTQELQRTTPGQCWPPQQGRVLPLRRSEGEG